MITRKDIATMLNVSVGAVRRNEKRVGLDRARCDINPRLIRYDLIKVRMIFVAHGWPVPAAWGIADSK
jgi:hypothetical protein